MSEPREFHIGIILSVLGNKLVAPIGGVYEILNHLTGDSFYTHQLPRAARECRPFLAARFPELAAVDDTPVTGENWREWLAQQVETFGATRMVESMPDGVHEYRNPLAELQEMVGPDRIVVLQTNENDGEV